MKFRLIFILVIYPLFLFGATPDKVGDEPPYHLKRDDPESFQVTVHAVTIVKNDRTEVELFYDAAGTTIDLAASGSYTSLTTASNIPTGTYTEARLYTSYTYGLKGYTSYQHDVYVPETRYYYTKDGSTETDDSMLSTDSLSSMPNYGFHINTLTAAELGSGSYAAIYNGISVIQYPKTLDNLVIPENETVTLTITVSVDQALELNDEDTNSSVVVSAPHAITYQAPEIQITSD